MTNEKQPQLRYILEGFVPEREFRLFSFQAVDLRPLASGGGRTAYTVRTDLSLVRKYGIHLQELPLLCRELLERRPVSEAGCHLTLTEEDLRVRQAERLIAEAARKKWRRAPPGNAGQAWRTTSPLVVEKQS
jgi:hypothetical protein